MLHRASFVVPACAWACVLGGSAAALAADPWADRVVSYEAGDEPAPGYTDPSRALGEPTRLAGVGVFPTAVTPFNPPWMPEELVSLGRGGSLVVAFDEPVTDDPLNPFGIDLLVFGNSFYQDADSPNGTVGTLFAGGGRLAVSADGLVWHEVIGVAPDGAFPTLGYLDLAGPTVFEPGDVPSDFTRPVDPALDPTGLTFHELVSAYDGSGGGAGVDLGALGLDSISFVRVWNPVDAPGAIEIDALADVRAVPAPAALALLAAGARRRRRR